MQPSPPNTKYSTRAGKLEKRVWEMMGKNDVRQAIADCERLNRRYPDFAPGWHTASHLALKLNRPEQALIAIEKALSLDCEKTAWLLQQALCLARLGRMNELGDLADQLVSREMNTPYQCSALAMTLTHLGRREQAIRHYRKAAALEPSESKHYYNMACLQRSLGELDSAEQNFDRSISLNPSDYEAYKIRSELRAQTREDNHIPALEKVLENGVENPRGKTQICYALAKELEDLCEHERSFGYLKMGAQTRRRHMQYNLGRDLNTMAAIQQTFHADLFKKPPEGDDNSEAIFILGMPRTGTTLVERILASHSQVFAAGELTNFAVQMMGLLRKQAENQTQVREKLVELSANLDFGVLGRAYVESTRPFTGHTERFIDKLPLNYLYVGLIHLALPSAKIVNLKRHPLDTCYAIYKQLFVDAYPFSYDLEELGQYYVAYQQLMDHWNLVLPGIVHTVEYENLVTDFEII
jgi:tetratricopeptide (TPR) repeat protein